MGYHPSKLEVPVTNVKVVERPASNGLVDKLISFSPEEAAKALARMDYGSQALFFKEYETQIKGQSESDTSKGRSQLPVKLDYIANLSSKMYTALSDAWQKICKKRMTKIGDGYRGT